MPVVVLVLSMEPHYHYKDIIKASKIVTEQLLITIINLILYKKNIQRAVQFLAITYGDFYREFRNHLQVDQKIDYPVCWKYDFEIIF